MPFSPHQSPDQLHRLTQMIELLEAEDTERYQHLPTPLTAPELMRIWRSLVNVRPPMPAGEAYLALEDAFLQENLHAQQVTAWSDTPLKDREALIHLWQGDITLLDAHGIVNAANSGLTGCYAPCHGCIDNVIHTFAGVRLRLACHDQMKVQGHPEPTGQAKITPGFNLPAQYVLHTVGPIITRQLRPEDEGLLASCYRECLKLASLHGLSSIAFPCISTGEFHFPKARAAEIAVNTVRQWIAAHGASIHVIFNVYLKEDRVIYERLLGRIAAAPSRAKGR